jgi:hypothetical protein
MPTSKKDTDMIDRIQKEMQDRLDQLQPAVDEYNSIATALDRLKPRRVGRPKGSKNKAATNSATKEAPTATKEAPTAE